MSKHVPLFPVYLSLEDIEYLMALPDIRQDGNCFYCNSWWCYDDVAGYSHEDTCPLVILYDALDAAVSRSGVQ